jgi:O-antigen/teichoic acid export membrane protein
MSLTRRIFFGAAASWFSRVVTILLGLVLLPVLFKNLPKEEVGIWLLLGQSWAAMGILDLGFGVTLTRQIAFAKGMSGSDPGVKLNEASLKEIGDVLATGIRIYRVLAVIAFLLSFFVGALYVKGLALSDLPAHEVWIAWGVLCLSYAVNTWANPWSCLLQGVGYVGWDALLLTFINALTLAGQILAVFMGGGLVSLAVVAVAGAMLQRFIFFAFTLNRYPELAKAKGIWQKSIWQKMQPLALRSWLTALGFTLVLNSDHLFVAKIGGASSLPMYRAAYLIFLNINVLAVTVASISAVFVSHLWQSGEIAEIQRIVFRNSRLGMFVMAAGGGCILGMGSLFFDFWLGPGSYVGQSVATVFFILLLLEAQTYIITTASRATEDEAFVAWSLAAGGLKVLLSWLLGQRFGLLGIALGTLIAQLLTNHWYMVHRGLQRLQIGLRSYLKQVVAPMLGLLILSFTMSYFISRNSGVQAVWLTVSMVLTLSATVLAVALWFGVLDKAQRDRLIHQYLPICR